jgi:hypothetical protein
LWGKEMGFSFFKKTFFCGVKELSLLTLMKLPFYGVKEPSLLTLNSFPFVSKGIDFSLFKFHFLFLWGKELSYSL